MERFDMSFRNKRVRAYVMFLLPLAIVAMLLFLFLPVEFQFIPIALMFTGLAGYYIWVFLDRRKQKGSS